MREGVGVLARGQLSKHAMRPCDVVVVLRRRDDVPGIASRGAMSGSPAHGRRFHQSGERGAALTLTVYRDVVD